MTSTVTTDSGSWIFGPTSSFDRTPQPRGEFDDVSDNNLLLAEYVGDPDRKNAYFQIGVSVVPLEAGEERPELRPARDGGGSSSTGETWMSASLEPGDLDGTVFLGGGGGGGQGIGDLGPMPAAYAADLYLNRELAAELTLLPVEGGPQ